MSITGLINDRKTRIEVPLAGRYDAAAPINLGSIFIWLAALLAAGVAYAADADLRLSHPALLLPTCLWLLWPARSSSVRQVQEVVFLYLMWIVFVACFDVLWTIPGPKNSSVRVSSTVLVAALVGLGQLVRRWQGVVRRRPWRFTSSALGWAVVVILAHAAFLLVLLRRFYGFGWEEDWAVLGRIGFCVIVLMGLMPVARAFVLRASLSFMAAMVLLARTLS